MYCRCVLYFDCMMFKIVLLLYGVVSSDEIYYILRYTAMMKYTTYCDKMYYTTLCTILYMHIVMTDIFNNVAKYLYYFRIDVSFFHDCIMKIDVMFD